jgi:Zn-finger nucleic acid-binding protein
MSERQGIEIEHYCPTCRGAWLDRSELDRLIERSRQTQTHGHDAPAQRHDHRGEFKDSDLGHGHRGHDPSMPQQQHGQRRSFWRELFD